MQSKRIMWAASALVLLAGCQKTPQSGQIVRFTAVSQPAVLTKVQYTGELSGTTERIDWKQGDAIRIYSSGAKASNDPNYTWADYAVTANGTADGAKSKASISVSSPQGGLTWGAGTNTFYAIYPKPTAGDDPTTVRGGTSGTPFNGTVPAAQEGTAISVKDLSNQSGPNINVYYPTNASAYHLAYASMSEPATEATLEFDPAYTAFHVSAGYKDTDMTIKSVTLKAASGNALSGDFTAYRGGSGWTFGCPAYASGSNDAVTFTFAGGNPELSSTKPKVEFVLYALPKELTNLTLDFLVEIAGVEKHRTLELKTAAAGTYYGHTYAAGESLIFNACKKSYIKGLLIPGATWTIDGSTTIKLRELVGDWDAPASNGNVNYGDTQVPPVFNATGLNQYGTSDKEFDFSIFAPKGGTWKVTAVDALTGSTTADSKLVILTQEGGTTTSTDGVLSGTIGTANAGATSATWIHFTATSGPTTGSYALKFSVELNGVTYSIDSEVIRNGFGSGSGQYKVFSF